MMHDFRSEKGIAPAGADFTSSKGILVPFRHIRSCMAAEQRLIVDLQALSLPI